MHKLFAAACLLLALPAFAALPAPTPKQAEAAAAKKAQAAAAAEKEKLALAATTDALAARWRGRAATEGWKANPPVAIAAA
ncbi:MAG: hypothetical protein ACXWU7_04360, partial [Telluria sp.]